MNIQDLKQLVSIIIDNIKNHGVFPNENNLYDYKQQLNLFGLTDAVEVFMRNMAKDILSFCNGNGGIILFGIKEDKTLGTFEDVGLDVDSLNILSRIDLNSITQKFEKISKVGVSIDLQQFQLGTRKYYYLLIEKQNQVLIPTIDLPEYKIKKGEILYRASSKTEVANTSTENFNRFLQIKANEKNKEFMEIWSKLLPEMFDINPREVLIINPKNNRVYGFNGKENILSSSEIEIDKTESGVLNVILNAISAGEIGKISDTEGKPIYKIIGEITSTAPRNSISISTVQSQVSNLSKYKISNAQLKQVMKYLGWVNDSNFKVENPFNDTLNSGFEEYIWIESIDAIKDSHKVVCSKKAIDVIVKTVNDQKLHESIFGRVLTKFSKSSI